MNVLLFIIIKIKKDIKKIMNASHVFINFYLSTTVTTLVGKFHFFHSLLFFLNR